MKEKYLALPSARGRKRTLLSDRGRKRTETFSRGGGGGGGAPYRLTEEENETAFNREK